MRRRRRSTNRTTGASRRQLLLGLGGAGLVGFGASAWTGAFSSVTAARNSTIELASDANAYLGLEVYSPVKRNSWEPMVDVTNNLEEGTTVTVSLETRSDGQLRGPSGDTACGDSDSTCSVSFDLAPGNAKLVEINADVKDTTVPFVIDADPVSASVTATRETYAESGNTKGAVTVKKVQDFAADVENDEWTIKEVDVRAKDYGFGRVEYEVRDADGTLVASDTVYPDGRKYNPKWVTLSPDDGHAVRSGETYTLRVTGYDTQENYDTATRSAST